jgi:hypothetical protein
MSYITRSELRSLVDPTGTNAVRTPASLSDAQLDEIILWQESLIDARLASLYTTPFSPTPDLVKWLSLAFSAYHAWLTIRNTVDLEERDPAQLRYNSAQNLLTDLANGDALLPGATTDDGVTDPYNRFDDPVFTKKMFKLPDPKTAEASERHTFPYQGWPYGQ